jgi:hypothetical protein
MVTVHAARIGQPGIRRHATSASPDTSPGKHGFGSRRVTDRRATLAAAVGSRSPTSPADVAGTDRTSRRRTGDDYRVPHH